MASYLDDEKKGRSHQWPKLLGVEAELRLQAPSNDGFFKGPLQRVDAGGPSK